MNLTTASPADIDARLVALEFENSILMAKFQRELKIANGSGPEEARQAAAAEAMKIQKIAHPVRRELNDIEAEWRRRGMIAAGVDIYDYNRNPHMFPGWSRVWVVPGGHCHRSRTCHSLYADTTTILAPRDILKRDLSGATEEEIVAAVGERACTFCYPSAPVDRPSTIVLPDEDAKMKARAEREAKRQAAAAAKAAKAITYRDGSRIRHDGWFIDTEAEARRIYVQTHADAAWDAYRFGAQRHEELKAGVEHLLIAIADKHGRDVEELREELAPKIAAKAKRDRRESEKHARALGLPIT